MAPIDPAWSINHIRIDTHRGTDGRWRITLSAFVKGEFRTFVDTVDAGGWSAAVAEVAAQFEHRYRGEERL